MAKITAEMLPKFSGKTDVLSAKAWFGKLASFGGTFHADDTPDDIVTASGEQLFDARAAAIVKSVVSLFREASANWPDPDFLYHLAGNGRFDIEKAYPGFIVDRGVPAALRTGYVTLPGQALPTLIVEECNEFVAIQFVPGEGCLSKATEIKVIPTSGIGFAPPSSRLVPRDGNYIDVSRAVLDHGRAVSVSSFDELEDIINSVTQQIAAPPRI